MVVKSVEIDLSVSGDAESKAKLDAISARADELKKAFPTYALKIDSAAATSKLAVFRTQLKTVADTAAKPMEVNLLSAKATKALDDIRLRADKLKATFPEFTAKIDDTAYKAKLAVMAAEAKATGDLISKELSAGPSRSAGSKILGLLPGVGGGAGGGAGGAAGAASSGGSALASLPLPAILAVTAAAALAIPVIASLATVAVGAGAGLAAFAAVGANAYGKLTSDIAALHTANENFSESAANVDTAISTSAANAAIYNKALAAMPPNLRSAAVLLGDQNARWQDLSKAQQNNVVALANNSAALKTLLPSQKTALTQLIAGKKAWDDMTPAQQAAATSMNTISTAWGKLTTAMEPSVMKVIAAAMDQVAKAIGPIGALAKAAVPGITQMVGVLGGGFITFLKGIAPLVGPSFGALNSILKSVFTAINTGLVPAMVAGLPNFVKMSVAVGKLTGDLILMLGALFRASSWIIANGIPALHAIAVAFDDWRHNVAADVHQVSDIIDTLRTVFAKVFHDMAGAAIAFGLIMARAAKAITDVFLNMVGNIINGAAKAFGWIPGLGGKLRGAAADFSTWRTGVNSDFDKVIAKMQAWQNGLNASKTTAHTALAAIGSSYSGLGVVIDPVTAKANALTKALTQIPKNTSVKLTETGTGAFSISQSGVLPNPVKVGTGPKAAAAGMYVAAGTGPTADDVIIRASRGELVVPAHLVSSGVVDHLKGLIPGFAAGGSIGSLAGATASFHDRFVTTMTAAMEKAMTAGMKAAIAVAQAAAAKAAAVAGGGGPVSADAGAAQKYAASRMGAYGWAANQMIALMPLWNQESGWNRFAYNASSGATGIPQALPFSKMPRAAWLPSQGGQASAGAQVDWGLGYIKGRYGSPAGAEAHEQAFNWYDRGGWLPTGLSLALNTTGRPERVGGGADDPMVAELRALRAELRQLNATAAAIPAKTGQHVGGAINGAAAQGSFRARYS